MRTILATLILTVATANTSVAEAPEALRAIMLTPREFDDARAANLSSANFNAVVLLIEEDSPTARDDIVRACDTARQHQLPFHFWIEVARAPQLARQRPELMASLQGHAEWRRFFPKSSEPDDSEVVKTYPWVPILSREGFDAQLARVTRLAADLPTPAGLFLNDLQGAPSACGCGHPLCRWTADYGPKRTNTKLGPEAAAQFIEAVQRATKISQVVHVWTTDCEAHDKQTLCAGVGCYAGLCWKEWTRQLMPLSERSPSLALLLPFQLFERDLPVYGDRAGWLREVVELMAVQPRRHGGQAIAPRRLIAVLQGWDVTQREVMAQIAQAQAAGVGGLIVVRHPIEQSWEPRVVRWK